MAKIPLPSNIGEAIKRRQARYKNTIIIIVGKQRSGKSYAGLQLCSIWDDTFGSEKIFFEVADFLKWESQRKKIRWEWALLDEMGIEADSHRWQMESARILKYVLEAGAFRKINLILTVPYFSMIIRQGRGLAHFLILMIRQGYGWLYVLDADYYRDKLYHWWWHSIHFPLPPKHIIVDYERKKARYWAKKVDEWAGVKYINKGAINHKHKWRRHRHTWYVRSNGTVKCRYCGEVRDKNGKILLEVPSFD